MKKNILIGHVIENDTLKSLSGYLNSCFIKHSVLTDEEKFENLANDCNSVIAYITEEFLKSFKEEVRILLHLLKSKNIEKLIPIVKVGFSFDDLNPTIREFFNNYKYIELDNDNPIGGFDEVAKALNQEYPIRFLPLKTIKEEGVKMQKITFVIDRVIEQDILETWEFDITDFISFNNGDNKPIKLGIPVAFQGRAPVWLYTFLAMPFYNKSDVYIYTAFSNSYIRTYKLPTSNLPKEIISKDLVPNENYDIALSFAGEEREFVQKVAEYLRKKKIKVFYDQYEDASLWGKDLYQHLNSIYKDRCKFCIVFISNNYASKKWTKHELKAIQARALEEENEYLLPVRFDNSKIDGINSTTAYLDGNNYSPERVAELAIKKLQIKK
ncbi:MAG: TIR domain-containing protein [Bacteroidetes bacterium]|nr:TIR domain-containing protein [Bacteroidota bacterium]